MRRLNRHSEQGGATVEFALITMLLVPMVLYAIYAGESIAGGIKAMEAEISAGWEITAYRTHAYDGGNARNLLDSAANDAATRTTNVLKDFDSFHDAGTNGYYGVFGHMTLDDVQCKVRDTNYAGGMGPYVFGTDYLKRDGWVACQSAVHFENLKAVKNAHNEFFQNRPKIIQDSFNKLVMGGLGKNFKGCDGGDNSTCPTDDKRGFVVLTDDYGLEDASEVTVGSSGPNSKYYKVGDSMWGVAGVSAGAAGILTGVMAFLIGSMDQGDTGTFHMGYLSKIADTRSFGNDGGGMDLHLTPQHEKASEATKQTSDLSKNAYDRRKNYYLAVDETWNNQ